MGAPGTALGGAVEPLDAAAVNPLGIMCSSTSRQQLHQRIDMKRCDVTDVTERSGSPQTLVCTKTQRSYERRIKQFDADTKLLAELEALAGARRVAVRRSSVRSTTKRR